MKREGFYIWSNIENKASKPVCTYEKGIKMIAKQIQPSNLEIAIVDLKKADYRSKKKLLNHDKGKKKLILPISKKKAIDNFIIRNNLNSKRDFIYLVLLLLNNETSSIFEILKSSKELAQSFKNIKIPERDVLRVIKIYEDRYVPKGGFVSSTDMISISFKFSNPKKTITINNFKVIGDIMDVLRKNYDTNQSKELNLETTLLDFKKNIAGDLFRLFFKSREIFGTTNKSKACRLINEVFLIAEVDATTDIIRKWVS